MESRLSPDGLKLDLELEKYRPYLITSHILNIKSNDTFMGTLYHDNTKILGFTYILLGAYDDQKNVWMWYSMSNTLNKSMVRNINDFRKDMTKIITDNKVEEGNSANLEKMKKFIIDDLTVLPTIEINNIVIWIEKYSNMRIITQQYPNNHKRDFILIKKILYSAL